LNSGFLTSLTNENASTQASGNTPGDSAHTSNYSYDLMFRITSGQAPPDPANNNLRATTSFNFSAPNSFPVNVQRSKSVTTALSDSATSFFDGLGRGYKSQHVLPGNTATVDTTFDLAGHAATVSNPYFSTSDPTYGTTTNAYDGLDRVTQTTKQDGSISQVAYNVVTGAHDAVPGVNFSGDCTDTTDEAGKQRRGCVDGLGRLVMVVEPNPGAAATTATGAVTISGNEQNTGGAAAPSTATITITGNERSFQDCLNTCHTVWDVGTVAVTAAGYPAKSVTYGHGDTLATIAWKLGCAFHNDTNAAADGPCPASAGTSSSVTLTTRASGAATAYSFTTSSATTDQSGDFTGASFFAGPNPGAFSGGHDAGTPDSGDVTISVNGTNYTVSFGAGDTGSTIATRLSSAMSGSAVVSASAVGNQVNLTSKMAGSAGNAALSASYTWNTAIFPQPSFTTTASGVFGGYDAMLLDNNPYKTLYTYDALGNLTCVEQHGDAASGTGCPATPPGPTDAPVAPDPNNAWRRRLFAYDSLSRLRWASNPESGVITYTYDADGELLQKTSPAPNPNPPQPTQTVSYCYDELHRVTMRDYQPHVYNPPACPITAPVVSYAYDSGTNAKGHLTSLTDQAGTATYAYDILGRMTTETRPIAGISKSTSYTYNLGGSIKTLTYPSGRVVTYTPDSAGRLVSAVDGNGTNYVVSADYNPDGSIKSLLNGSTPGLSQNFQYTPRLQLCRITTLTSGTLPTSCTDSQHVGNIMDRGYDFHAGNGTAGSGADNGNVFAITNYRDTNRSQTFTYDALNRLTSGWSSANTGSYSWGENYSIDAWGNLQMSPMQNKAHGGTFQLSGNAQNRPTGMNYDAAGNLISYLSATYTYDQENRLSSTAGMSYMYDGNGERVLKSNASTGAAVKRYWSMSGNTLAEDDGSGNLTAEYIYFGGKRVARIDLPANTVHYYLSDHLGSTSIVASAAGAVEEESDYYPFGTEVVVTGPGVNELKFTGKRRDTESQLDYFGARYFDNPFGRFMTPDPLMLQKQKLGDPQQWNMYQYARNNPLRYLDPSGKKVQVSVTNG
jgi:RHS repeat-associated protein